MRTSRRSVLFVMVAVAVMVAWEGAARAQSTGRQVNVHQFELTPDARGVITVESATTPGHLRWMVGATFSYINDPLVAVSNGETVFKFIHHQVMADVVVGIGFTHYIGLGIHLPVVLYQTSDGDPARVGGAIPGLSSAAVGDLRIVPKFRFWKDKGHGFGLALVPAFTLPSGMEKHNAGDSTVTFEPRFVLDYRLRQGTLIALNLGARVRKSVTAANLLVGNEFLYSLGAEVPVWRKRLSVLGEIYGAVGFKDSITDGDKGVDPEEAPLQALLGVRYRFPVGVILTGGVGFGLTDGYGTPDYRLFLGVAYSRPAAARPVVKDSDGDGLLDTVDRCPKEPEDKDGFEDDDGCPDPDNDKDGVCDGNPTIQAALASFKDVCKGVDKAPLDPEDKDGFEDDDGVPDPDNDKDGVCDDNPTIQGAPDKYKDVCKGADKAPNDAEDKDGFEDDDGVPDPDNDRDGVCDDHPTIQKHLAKYAAICKGSDVAPTDPEDKDGFEDDDGAPDPDNDKDGVCDDHPTIQKDVERWKEVCTGRDKCPLQPGTDQGCPAKGPTALDVRKRQIVIMEAVNFVTGSAQIMKSSHALLKSVAQILKDNLWVKSVEVQGHTDDRGNDNANLKLSQRRAESVKAFLIKEGVAADRLEAKGYGETAPLESCTGLKGRKAQDVCWAKNRRVVFQITKTDVGTAPGGTTIENPHR